MQHTMDTAAQNRSAIAPQTLKPQNQNPKLVQQESSCSPARVQFPGQPLAARISRRDRLCYATAHGHQRVMQFVKLCAFLLNLVLSFGLLSPDPPPEVVTCRIMEPVIDRVRAELRREGVKLWLKPYTPPQAQGGIQLGSVLYINTKLHECHVFRVLGPVFCSFEFGAAANVGT